MVAAPVAPPTPSSEVPLPHRSSTPSVPGVVVRRAQIETTPSLAPVAMSTSLGLASRGAADPTMQLSRIPRGDRASGLGVALALFAAALVSGLVVGGVAVFPDQLARGRAAVSERLLGGKSADEAASAAPAVDGATTNAPAAPAVDGATTSASAASAVDGAVMTSAPAAPAADGAATTNASVASAATPNAAEPPATRAMPTVSPDALPPAAPAPVAPATEEVAPTMTRVILPSYAKGHRVFVDGRVVGEGAEPITVACGKHKIQIGSRGRARARNLPCGGELALD
ncbi:MAG: hypothetical protein KIS78_02885 [Labilithrix sp.]|nr:hypothetical protein [Labilithrix sp.]